MTLPAPIPSGPNSGPSVGGPVTAPANTFGPGIVSSSGVRSNFIQDSGVLNELAANDPYRVLVANQLATNAANQGVGISNATAAGANQEIQAEQAGHAYTEGVAKAGAASGLTRSAPEYSQGLLSEAASKESMKLQDLQEKEDLGIAKATAAKQSADSTALKEAVAYVKEVRAAKATALERLQTQSNADRNYALSAAKFQYTKDKAGSTTNAPVKFTQNDIQSLTASGIPPIKISLIQDSINQYGLDATLANSDMTQKQKDAITTASLGSGNSYVPITTQ